MIRFIKNSRLFRRGIYREDGNATIEFVIIFPAIMTLFLMGFETGLLLTRGVMLDRGVDIAMRELRLGSLDPMTHDQLKISVCDNSVIIPDCQNALLIELRPIDETTWAPLGTDTTCVDRNEDIQPALDFIEGGKNEMMLVRVCAVFDPFFPTGGLAAQIKLDASGAYALVATSAYVNEP